MASDKVREPSKSVPSRRRWISLEPFLQTFQEAKKIGVATVL
jgi:hypothetical protein